MIIEVFGGITPHALAHVSYLARRAKSKGSRDGTKYGKSRTSPKSFFGHHVAHLALAANVFDAKAIRKSMRSLKQRQLAGGCAAGTA